ncbi:hypothetical protein LSTR_LSTR000477 [Laodelphax striatellus]|uniref:Uncharacterized protein n=1 Tax=Laodelphax striatellus TaxID=195883 RepID=A0A482X1V9_LAOST|nr:hypothetical protein LSTR_LSTR000477 [Laodelphax striatellus]
MSNLAADFRKEIFTPHARSRSVFTTHNNYSQMDEPSYQNVTMKYNGEYCKYLDNDQWTNNGMLATPSSNLFYQNANDSASVSGFSRYPRAMKYAPFYSADDSCNYPAWRDLENMEPAAVATPHGTMSLRLHSRIRVDMTLDRSVRVINFKNNIVIALSGNGSSSALLHPNGRIHQYGSRVEILAHDVNGNNKLAKMWYKGVSFSSAQCALIYLVDSAGTRTTTDHFSELNCDFSLPIFYNDCRYGPMHVQEAVETLKAAQYWSTDDGVENWIINNIRISQTTDGLVRIARNSNKYQIRTSPSNGTASLTTPFLHCTASMGDTSHLFVRRGERRMHYDGNIFIVRNAGHSAGFDEKNQLKVY